MLKIVDAEGLPAMDSQFMGKGTSDPYVKVLAAGKREVFKTDVQKKTLSPVWNASCDFRVGPEEEFIDLIVYDYDAGSGDDPMGRVTLNISELEEEEEELRLHMLPEKKCPKARGTLTVIVAFRECFEIEHKLLDYQIDIIEAQELLAMDKQFMGKGSSDPYVRVMCSKEELFRTESQSKTLNPRWDTTCTVSVRDDEKEIVLALFDSDFGSGDDPMGRVTLQLQEFRDQGTAGSVDQWYKVEKQPECKKAKGKLHARCTWLDGITEPPPPMTASGISIDELKAKERKVTSLERTLANYDKQLNEAFAESQQLSAKVRKLKMERRQLRREKNQKGILEKFLWTAVRRVITLEKHYKNINLDQDVHDLVRLGRFYPIMKKKAIIAGASELQHRLQIKESGGLPSIPKEERLGKAVIWLCYQALPKPSEDSEVADVGAAISLLRTATEKRQSRLEVDAVISRIVGERPINASVFAVAVTKLELNRRELVSLLDAAEELNKKHRPSSAVSPAVQEEVIAPENSISSGAMLKLLTKPIAKPKEIEIVDELEDSTEDELPCVDE